MALIRQATAKSMARDAVVLDLGDLTRQAEQIKARARAEAEAIVAQAHQERVRILDGAAEEGHREGLARGLEEGKKKGLIEGRATAMVENRERIANLERAWSEALETFTIARERMLADMRHDALRLAVQMGEMVTKRSLRMHPEAVVDQLAAVLAIMMRPTRLTVSAHPDDLPLLKEAMPSLVERFNAAMHVELLADPDLSRGSCIVQTGGTESDGGEIDASITTQLERIVEALLPSDFDPVSAEPPEEGNGP